MTERGSHSSHRGLLGPVVFLVLTAVVLTACAGSPSTPGRPSPSGSARSMAALKLAVLDAVGGHLAYCDPDAYPVAHLDDVEAATQRFPTIQADREAFQAILAHEHLTAGESFSPAELVAINNLFKQMQAISVEPDGDAYRFDVLALQSGSDVGNFRVTGTVDRFGNVTIERRQAGHPLACPICLAAGVRIATPGGSVPVQDVRVGMRVWTTDAHGRRVIAVVVRTGHMSAPLGHEVIRLALADGRSVVASPGHPTADGRTVGELRVGDRFDGSRVVAATPIAYAGGTTYDLLPSGTTGTYFANGILLASTLALTG